MAHQINTYHVTNCQQVDEANILRKVIKFLKVIKAKQAFLHCIFNKLLIQVDLR